MFLCSGCATFGHPGSPQTGFADPDLRTMGSRRRTGAHEPPRPMFLWTTAAAACGKCPAQRAAVYAFMSASSRKIVSREPAAVRPALPPRHGPEGHAASVPRDQFPSLPKRYRVAKRRRFRRARLSCPKAHPFVPNQPGRWSPRSASLRRRSAAARQPVSKRLFNAQQDAHRCYPSGRDPGGRSAWPACGGVRLRVGQPQAVAR